MITHIMITIMTMHMSIMTIPMKAMIAIMIMLVMTIPITGIRMARRKSKGCMAMIMDR